MTYRLTVSKTYPHAGAIVGVWVVCISALTQIGFNQSRYCKAVKHQQNVSVSQFAGLANRTTDSMAISFFMTFPSISLVQFLHYRKFVITID